MSKVTLEKLNSLYEAGKTVDRALFSEQRTNILLKMGDHYKRVGNEDSSFNARGKSDTTSNRSKIRLTKNHIHRISNEYQNQILEANPSVTAVPFNESELHDVKVAAMNNGVIDWIKKTNNWAAKQDRHVHDFVVIGETFAKIRYDYSKGKPVPQQDGEKLGEFVIDRLFGFDMKRDPNARDADETKWWIHEQMMDFAEFKKTVKSLAPDKIDRLTSSMNQTVKIFDANTGSYRDVKNQVLVKEYFYKPDAVCPNGVYAMFTDNMLIVQSDIPYGIYPISYVGFDEYTTSPRSASIIKVCRPYQIEINRASSKMAEHQITLGDDKVFIQSGTKITNGGTLHGVRAFKVSGKEPIIQPGRSGAQYLDYEQHQIAELYQAVNLSSLLEDKASQSGDPYQLLFRSMKEKKRFSKYASKYERFEIEIFEKCIAMAKAYLTPNHIIKISSKKETINVPEFKRADQDGYEIKVVAQSGDVESKFGKIMSATQTLQYVGSRLDPDQLGMLIKQLPLGNEDQMFSTLTVDSDNMTNDILSLDRGEQVEAFEYENHEFIIKGLNNRMKQADFRFLDERIKGSYRNLIDQHNQFVQQQAQAIAQNDMGMIPQGGFLTTVNASWFNPTTKRVERIKVPAESIKWLVDKLQTQGQFSEEMEGLPPSEQARIAQMQGAQTAAQGDVRAPSNLEGLSQPQAGGIVNNVGPQAPQ